MSKLNRLYIGMAVIVALLLILSSTTVANAGKPTPTPTPGTPPPPPPVPAGMRAGLRASDYGISPWPSTTWWVNSINSMASRFPTSTGSGVFIPVEIDGMKGPGCWAHFPNPDGGTYPGVRFDPTDKMEPDFTAFDQNGIHYWVQVEPSACDVPMLIDLLMKEYGHHTNIVGIGVDVEWYLNKSYRNGKAVTDAEAQAWVAKVRTYDTNYKVFLKHWMASKMPPTYRDGLVLVDDSQGFRSMDAMMTEFATWGQAFAPAPVGFQFGYASDRSWWSKLADPPRDIGNGILRGAQNTSDLIWVDFTAYDIWPPE